MYQLSRDSSRPPVEREGQLPKPVYPAVSLSALYTYRMFQAHAGLGLSLFAPLLLFLPFLLPLDPFPCSLYPHQSLDVTHKDDAFGLQAFPPGCLPGTLVRSMVRSHEKQLEVSTKKPAGEVGLFCKPNAGPQRTAVPGGKPQVGRRTLEAALQFPTEPALSLGD